MGLECVCQLGGLGTKTVWHQVCRCRVNACETILMPLVLTACAGGWHTRLVSMWLDG